MGVERLRNMLLISKCMTQPSLIIRFLCKRPMLLIHFVAPFSSLSWSVLTSSCAKEHPVAVRCALNASSVVLLFTSYRSPPSGLVSSGKVRENTSRSGARRRNDRQATKVIYHSWRVRPALSLSDQQIAPSARQMRALHSQFSTFFIISTF